ncbi:MAG TPA: WYL domain-containing protein [Stellaceae bacterium]|nr:WYL domain-containing protein [Stellaceae bacterium]
MATRHYHPARVLRSPDTHRRRSARCRPSRSRSATPQAAGWQTTPTAPAPTRQRPRRQTHPGVDVTLVGAWCELRNDFRNFRADRIVSSRVLDENFSPEHGRLAAEWFALSKEAPNTPQ